MEKGHLLRSYFPKDFGDAALHDLDAVPLGVVLPHAFDIGDVCARIDRAKSDLQSSTLELLLGELLQSRTFKRIHQIKLLAQLRPVKILQNSGAQESGVYAALNEIALYL